MNWVRSGSVLMLLALCPPSAYAQRIAPDGVPYRAWDLDFGAGVHFADRRDASVEQPDRFSNDWGSYGVVGADVGYYWTDHWKTEVGFSSLSTGDDTANDSYVLRDGRVVQAFRQLRVKQTQIVVNATYQFLENGFTHPYVSAGMRFGVLSIDSSRYPWGYVSGSPYTQIEIPADPRHTVEFRARPYVALGSKSYFSERVFVRPELAVALNASGLSQVVLRLGAGIDF